MNINIKATNMELTDSVRNHVNKHLLRIEKFLKKGTDVKAYVEVAKTTNHHKQGDVYRAELNIEIAGNKFYSFSEKEDLHKSLDDVRNEIIRQIKSSKDRKQTLFKRGATSVKKMIKGISNRNPFTSKY